MDGDILFGGGNDRLFGVLADKLGYPDWKTDPRYMSNDVRVQNREELDNTIEETTKQKTTQEWLEIFEGSGMPYAAVNDIQGTLNHTHGECSIMSESHLILLTVYLVQSRGMVKEVEHPTCGPMKLVNTPVKYSHATPGIRSAPPTLGQHTDEVLDGLLDIGKEDIARLREEGAVA